MGDRTIINAVCTVLNAELLDPRTQWTGTNRTWIHKDRPLNSATFPRIQIRKRGPTMVDIASMGRTDFLEHRILVLDIQFWTASGFKYDTGTGVFIKDEDLVEEWLGKIWSTLKAQHNTFIDTYDISGLKDMGQGEPYLEPDTELYTGIISVRAWEFVR